MDYKELVTLKLPRSKAEKDRHSDSRLYPVEVIEKDSAAGRVKYTTLVIVPVMMNGEMTVM